MEKKLHRDERHKVIGGVCAGLADYFGVDVAIIRAIFLLTLILKGGGLLVYVVLWIVLPKRQYDFYNPGVDYRVSSQEPFNPFSGAPQPGAPFNNPAFDKTAFNNPSFGDNPFPGVQKKKASTVGLVFGVILILIGASFLLNEFDILPDWDLGKLWPLTLVFVGFALMISGQKKQPWEKENWHNTAEVKEEAPVKEDPEIKAEENNNLNDTPPTI